MTRVEHIGPHTMGWQPIETAPKDGSEIDVWVGGEFPRRLADVSWRKPTDSEWWAHGGDTIKTTKATWHDCFGPLDMRPTHWQPLPSPPSSVWVQCPKCNGRDTSMINPCDRCGGEGGWDDSKARTNDKD